MVFPLLMFTLITILLRWKEICLCKIHHPLYSHLNTALWSISWHSTVKPVRQLNSINTGSTHLECCRIVYWVCTMSTINQSTLSLLELLFGETRILNHNIINMGFPSMFCNICVCFFCKVYNVHWHWLYASIQYTQLNIDSYKVIGWLWGSRVKAWWEQWISETLHKMIWQNEI